MFSLIEMRKIQDSFGLPKPGIQRLKKKNPPAHMAHIKQNKTTITYNINGCNRDKRIMNISAIITVIYCLINSHLKVTMKSM